MTPAAQVVGLAAEQFPPLDPLVLSVPAGIATTLLVLHGLRYRGRREMAAFCIACVCWYLLKEWAITQRALQAHAYTVTAPMVRVLGIPLVLPVGYIFTGYVSWYFAERIVDRLPGCAGRLFPLIAVWLMFTSGIAYVMEAVGAVGQWWVWDVDDGPWRSLSLADRIEGNSGTIHPIIPYAPVYGWPLFSLPFAALVLAFEYSPLRNVRLKPVAYLIGFQIYFIFCVYNGLFTFVMLLFVLALWSRFPVGTRREPVEGWLRHAPAIAVAMMLATAFGIDVVHARDLSLLQSWIPLTVLLALAHTGRHTLLAVAATFAVLLLIEQTFTLRVHHACVYTGLILLMAAVRGWRERRSPAPSTPTPGRIVRWLTRGRVDSIAVV